MKICRKCKQQLDSGDIHECPRDEEDLKEEVMEEVDISIGNSIGTVVSDDDDEFDPYGCNPLCNLDLKRELDLSVVDEEI